MSATATDRERVSAIAQAQEIVTLDADHPDVDRLMMAYRTKFGLGRRVREAERAQVWRGVRNGDAIVAVYGEFLHGRELEVTDAYVDGTLEGKIAFLTMAKMYQGMLDRGEIDAIIYTILFANEEFWKAVVRETGDEPYCLVFCHRRKEPA